MKCKVCGAELRNEGDICKNCYAEMLEYEELEKDTKVIYKLKPKFIPIYEIFNKGEFLLVGLILVLCLLATSKIIEGIACSIVFIILCVLIFRFIRVKYKRTSCTFYEKKAVYKLRDKVRIIKYSDIQDIKYFQTFMQKLFGIGDIRVFIKSNSLIAQSVDIPCVNSVKNEFENLAKVVQDKIKV